MTFNIDAREDESHTKVGAGFSRLLPGRYHVEIVDVDETFQKQPNKVPVTFEVLAGTNPGLVGKKQTEFYSTSEAAMDRLKRLAMVCGLLKPGEAKEVSFINAIGSTLIIEIVPHSYEKDGKQIDTTQVDYGGMWMENDEEVKDVPRGKSSPKPQSDVAETTSAGEQKWDNI